MIITNDVQQEYSMSTPNCPNCDHALTDAANFCSNCGQKTRLGLTSVWRMIRKFFSETFNYDSRLVRTLRGLLQPGHLSSEYLQFKRVDYLSPIRLFFILMFLAFAMASLLGDEMTGVRSYEIDKVISRQGFILNMSEQIKEVVNEMKLEEATQSEIIGHIDRAVELLDYDADADTSHLGLFGNDYNIRTMDLQGLTDEELIEKYNIDPLLDRITLRAMYRIKNDPIGFLRFLVGNMTWAVMINVLLMSALFKLFYWRHKYVEHFIFQLHFISFAFVLVCLLSLAPESEWQTYLVLGLIALAVLYYHLAMLRVYRQGHVVTLFKSACTLILLPVCLLLNTVLVSLVITLLF